MTLENATPSPRTSTTVSSLDALRQARRRSSSVRGLWSWPWPPGHQDLAQCCSAPEIPTLSSSCRWVCFGVAYTLLSVNSSFRLFQQWCLNLCLHQGVTVCLDAMRKAFPATDSLQRTTKLFYSPTFRQSEAGIPIGPNSSTPASSRHMLNLYTTPEPAFEVLQDQTHFILYTWLLSVCTHLTFSHFSSIFSGSQWEGHPLPASPVCSQRSHSGNTGVQLCIHNLLRLLCFTGTFRLSF